MSSRATRVRRLAAVLAVVLAAVPACTFGLPDEEQAGTPPRFPAPSTSAGDGGDDREIAATVLASGLDVPWGIAFLPDGGALVTERDTGRILQVGPKSGPDGLVVTEVQRLTEPVPQGGDSGLLGIAVSPRYDRDRTVFVYYTTATDNRVAKLRLGGRPQPVLTGIPRSRGDNGGQLAFGPDGHLYVGTGDGTAAGGQAQNPANLGGKILRITAAGRPAPGNPKADSPVWTSGHRNVQGFAWDAGKRMYASETGQKNRGELNVVTRGRNYGWPAADGDGRDAKYTDPLVSWPAADSSCAGVAVVEQLVLTACPVGRRLWVVETTPGGTLLGRPQELLRDEYGRLRAAVAAPDGSLWVGTSNQEDGGTPGPEDDRLIRLVFAGGGAGRS